MQMTGISSNAGALGLRVYRAPKALAGKTLTIGNVLHFSSPFAAGLSAAERRWRWHNFPNVLKGAWRLFIAKWLKIPVQYGQLWLRVHRGDGTVEDLGLAGFKVVTTVGAGWIVDAWQSLVTLANMKYHGFGSGAGAEGAANTTLTTEFTTEYATDNVRPTGTTAEGASANIFSSVATFAPDGNAAVTEHSLFSQAATGGGVLFDKTLFSVINLVASSDSLVSTYSWTLSTGG